jgi:hypothetical protein
MRVACGCPCGPASVARPCPVALYREIAVFNLVSAAAATGVNRSAILRAIKAGRLSAQRDDNGAWEIQPCELFRVFPPLPLPTADQAVNNAIADLRNV